MSDLSSLHIQSYKAQITKNDCQIHFKHKSTLKDSMKSQTFGVGAMDEGERTR